MARRSTVHGAAAFRRLLKALPDSAHSKIVTFLSASGPVLAGRMKSLIPVLSVPRPNRTAGAARDSVQWKVTPTTMNLKVGELTKHAVVFYAHILDVGRKGKTVTIGRGSRKGEPMKIRAFQGLHIVSNTKTLFRTDSLPGYRSLMDDILLDASRGTGND